MKRTILILLTLSACNTEQGETIENLYQLKQKQIKLNRIVDSLELLQSQYNFIDSLVRSTPSDTIQKAIEQSQKRIEAIKNG